MTQETLTLVKHSHGLADDSTFEGTKAVLRAKLAELQTIQQTLTVDAPAASPAYNQLTLEQQLSVSHLLSDGTVVTSTESSSNLLSEFISSSQVLLSLPQQNCTMNDSFVYFVLSNHDVLHDVLSGGILLRYQDLTKAFDGISFKVCIVLFI
jgi:hypothetical protein